MITAFKESIQKISNLGTFNSKGRAGAAYRDVFMRHEEETGDCWAAVDIERMCILYILYEYFAIYKQLSSIPTR